MPGVKILIRSTRGEPLRGGSAAAERGSCLRHGTASAWVAFSWKSGKTTLASVLLAKMKTGSELAGPSALLHRKASAAPGSKKFGRLQLIVVGKFRPPSEEIRARVHHILTEHDVRLFAVKELPQLIEEIRTTGKDLDEIDG